MSSKGTLFWKHSNDVIMQRNTVLILLVRFNVESYRVVKSDQLLVQGGRVPVRQVEKQCGRDLPSRHCQDRTTQLEQLDMWQEARYVVQVYRHQQQTMTLTRAGHTTGTACMRNCKFLHEQVRGGPAGEMGHSGRPRWGQGAPRCRDPVPVHFPPPEPVLLAPQTKVAAFQGWRRLLLRGRFLPVLVVGRAHGTAES